jgi:outer membrane immunogenic protein
MMEGVGAAPRGVHAVNSVAGLACAACAAGAANAADMTPVAAAPASAPAPIYAKSSMMPYDWTGLYIGGHGSFDSTKIDFSTTNAVTGIVDGSASASRSGAHGGAQVGFDYEMLSRVVVGFAADVSNGDDISAGISNAAGTNVHTEDNKTTASGTVRARLGYVLGNVLFYGTGGWAWTNGTTTRAQLVGKTGSATPGTIEQTSLNLNGCTAGAGLGYGFWHNWEVFGEYRYTSYQSNTAAFPISAHSTTSTTTVSSVIAGLNFRFDPFIPRY